jgi:CheY-like chemotaxis protein
MAKKLIFYAEDDQDDRYIFETSFTRFKSEVDLQMFSDGLEILNYLKADPLLRPDLIVLDINMPQLDGKDVLRILRAMPAYSTIPIVLLTTSSSPVDRYFAQQFSAGFITKPMDEAEMNKITSDLLKFFD